ncbi:MAG: protein kinase, partial [Gemmatimonadetes bacterium]|nr:protein kinase [Gemmatimonadota bacterium]
MADDVLDRLKEALSGRYEVQQELDRGGMAVVYLAEDLRHHRIVAIKVLQPALSATLGTDRFLREIEVIANLQHPNILTLIDSGEVDGLPYYVMPYVEGQSLRTKLESDGSLPLGEAVRIASEVAEALEYAHQKGVVHRDIKPANILLSDGHAVVADFGIAGALDESAEGRLTKTGSSLGSPAYMSPEQASGERELDGRADVYGLACVVYEMLGGNAPFEGSLKTVVTSKVLGEFPPLKTVNTDVPAGIDKAVSKALAVEPDDRFATAAEFEGALKAGLPQEVPAGLGRKRNLVAGAAVLVVALLAVVAVLRTRAESARVLLAAQQLAEVENLAEAGQYTEALALAEEVEAVFPGDTTLARLLARISFTVPIRSDPPGAKVFIQRVEAPEGEWELLGETPLESVRFPGVSRVWQGTRNSTEDDAYRLRLELDGFRTRELYATAVIGVGWRGIPPLDPVPLSSEETLSEEMVLIPGFTWDSVTYNDYHMDRTEVTNRAFKEFVDAGGYRKPEYWVHPFLKDGAELTFQEAMAQFKDQTGRPGPSTWELGDYPDGQENFPVGGVSWYEAAAYGQFVGKQLPTTLHWTRARRHYRENSFIIVPRSNLGGDGPRAVGLNQAMTTVGVYDLVGNVREWCYNGVPGQGRATRGAAWTDAPFHVGWVIPKPEFDRHETNGIRLVKTFEEEGTLDSLKVPVVPTPRRDYWAEEPVSDVEYEVFRRLYAYEPFPLNAVVERTDTLEHSVRESISFDLPYGERGGVVLFLPRDSRFSPPHQAVIYWGGSGIMTTKSIDDISEAGFDYMVRDGRVVAVPILKGAYERDDSLFTTTHGSVLQ